MKGFVRIAAASPAVAVADPAANAEAILAAANAAADRGADLLLTPELSLTGYTCGDLFGCQSLAGQTETALGRLLAEAPEGLLLAVGLPVAQADRLYNCAALLRRGALRSALNKVVPRLALVFLDRIEGLLNVVADHVLDRRAAVAAGERYRKRCRQSHRCQSLEHLHHLEFLLALPYAPCAFRWLQDTGTRVGALRNAI